MKRGSSENRTTLQTVAQRKRRKGRDFRELSLWKGEIWTGCNNINELSF